MPRAFISKPSAIFTELFNCTSRPTPRPTLLWLNARYNPPLVTSGKFNFAMVFIICSVVAFAVSDVSNVTSLITSSKICAAKFTSALIYFSPVSLSTSRI